LQVEPLHIVALDVPYPPDYGGAIDMFYRIKSLSEAGIPLILHIFHYRRPVADMLNSLCKEIHYYERPLYRDLLHPTTPYIVASRKHPDLLKNLTQTAGPILFEGLHTTAFLDHPSLRDRIKIVRMHNIEHQYYRALAHNTRHPLLRIFFNWEAYRLKNYEPKLRFAQGIAAISTAEATPLTTRYGPAVFHLPVYQEAQEVSGAPGLGTYALYHGNLSVAENQEAALFLIRKVFSDLDYPLVIAGKSIPPALMKAAQSFSHIRLISDPDREVMDRLIREAHLIVLPAFQGTGVKIKLLQSLYKGRFVLVNALMLTGTELHPCCLVAESAADFQNQIRTLANQPFSEEEGLKRQRILGDTFNHQYLNETLLAHLYPRASD
jgi:hypothetical protein